ncbi:hypothetical protein OS493_029883 [Desmophyllum pertusum]|uniref:Uncharacterized protein n=1 Tax=Desmophyllum pertusum TaxID=174260 RepID=A0A9W9YC54_9CNID|nr:hypothetical protein OS493_029883 [Desmophyllum pertusum]
MNRKSVILVLVIAVLSLTLKSYSEAFTGPLRQGRTELSRQSLKLRHTAVCGFHDMKKQCYAYLKRLCLRGKNVSCDFKIHRRNHLEGSGISSKFESKVHKAKTASLEANRHENSTASDGRFVKIN